MNPTGNDDELDDAYRRASAGDAGRPGAATRSAILAEARAAALRRSPAANDSRMWWRAAAGVSVLGVALLLWRQVDHPLAPLDQTAAVAQAPAPAASAPAIVEEPASEAPRDANAISRAPEPFPANASMERQVAADAAQYAKKPASAAPAPPPASEAESRLAARSELGRSFAAPSLFERQFPDAWSSTTPPRALWILEDAAGNVLGSGIAEGSDWQVVRTNLMKEFADRNIGPWDIITVRNAQAVEVRIGVARLQ
ncbi:MAG: hypothetical protein ABIT36_00175 [Steroidobacteraceae bacterium]